MKISLSQCIKNVYKVTKIEGFSLPLRTNVSKIAPKKRQTSGRLIPPDFHSPLTTGERRAPTPSPQPRASPSSARRVPGQWRRRPQPFPRRTAGRGMTARRHRKASAKSESLAPPWRGAPLDAPGQRQRPSRHAP